MAWSPWGQLAILSPTVADWRLRYDGGVLNLSLGSVLIGRGESADLRIDDPRVSRQHAKIVMVDGRPCLEDLGSRNGVLVNGEKSRGRCPLSVGDVLTIGEHDIRVIPGRASAELVATRIGRQTAGPTLRFDPFGVVGELADKAFALGKPEEAERLLGAPIRQLLEEAGQGELPDADLHLRVTRYLVKLVCTTSKSEWLERLIELYIPVRRPWSGPVVEELYAAARRLEGSAVPRLREYIAVLRANEEGLGPAERFLVGRIEGLERLLAAR